MKRITYAGVAFATGTEVAIALLEYVTAVSRVKTAVTVDLPVQEENGTIGTRTLLLNETTQVTVDDIDGVISEEDELGKFPVPDFPAIGGKAVAEKGDDIESFPKMDELDLEFPSGGTFV